MAYCGDYHNIIGIINLIRGGFVRLRHCVGLPLASVLFGLAIYVTNCIVAQDFRISLPRF